MKHLYLSIILALLLPVHLQAQSCPAPYATADYSIGTDGFTVSFAAESCDPDVKYRWDFGDGASTTYAENNREPVHVYTSEPSNLRGYLNPATEGLAITASKAFFGNATYDNGTVQYRKNPNGKISSYFFVKNYDFDIGLPPNIPSSAPFFNTQTISNNINIPLPIVVTPNNLTITPADLEGVGGQGVNNPKSSFDNHVILSYKQQNGELVYFDPSYGKPNAGAYGSTSVYESDNIAGYGAEINYFVPSGEFIRMIWLHEKEDLSKTQLTIK